MYKAWLLASLMLSGCSIITTQPPKDLSQFAEVDVVIANDIPEVTISNVAAYTGFSSKYFGAGLYQKEPTKLFLSPGTYQLQVGCYGALYIQTIDDEPVGFIPELKISVDSGKKYWLGCRRNDSRSLIYLDEQQTLTQSP